MAVRPANEGDLPALLPLLRGYCDFYGVAPTDERLLALAQALIADPEREGVQLIARDDTGRAVGFATIYWSWETLAAGHDHVRPSGAADHVVARGAHDRRRLTLAALGAAGARRVAVTVATATRAASSRAPNTSRA